MASHDDNVVGLSLFAARHASSRDLNADTDDTATAVSDVTVDAASVCLCPCHTPEVLVNYHRPILAAFKYYLPRIKDT